MKPIKPQKPQNKTANAVDLSQQINKESHKSFESILREVKKLNAKDMKLVICIDFTNSNEFSGHKTYKACMHGPVSPYKKILQKMKSVISQLSVSEIHGLRFGDEETQDRLAVPLTGDGIYQNVAELINAYCDVCKTVKLGGPTSFEPIMKTAIDISQNKYYIFLLILTDGDISDIQRDKNALLNCSQYPISISALGLGDGPFDTMESYDDMKGRKFDNFHFDVWTEDIQDTGMLVFQELVEQYKDMQLIGLLQK